MIKQKKYFNMKLHYENAVNLEGIEWLIRQGHKIVELNGSYFYDHAIGIYQAFPYHQLLDCSQNPLGNFFEKTKALALRYSSPLNNRIGKLSYHVVFTKKKYHITSLSKKPRRDVKIGLKYASYEPIPISRLAIEGWKLRLDTLIRQGRVGAETREMWNRLCESADDLASFEAWGALHDDELVASLLSYKHEETVSILFQQSLTDHLKFGVNNALTYVFTHEKMQNPDVNCIFYGLESLDAPSSVDEYKFRMGYEAKPVLQRVVFNPNFKPFFGKTSYILLKLVCRLFSASALSKARGMLYFSIQGKYPLNEQSWPVALLDQRETILNA